MTANIGKRTIREPKCQLTAPVPVGIHVAVQQLSINHGTNFAQEVRRLLTSAIKAEGIDLNDSEDD